MHRIPFLTWISLTTRGRERGRGANPNGDEDDDMDIFDDQGYASSGGASAQSKQGPNGPQERTATGKHGTIASKLACIR